MGLTHFWINVTLNLCHNVLDMGQTGPVSIVQILKQLPDQPEPKLGQALGSGPMIRINADPGVDFT